MTPFTIASNTNFGPVADSVNMIINVADSFAYPHPTFYVITVFGPATFSYASLQIGYMDEVLDSRGKPNDPIIIGATFYNNANYSSGFRFTSSVRQRPILYLLQWGAPDGLPGGGDNAYVQQFSNYIAQGF
jgi:hypothetical protein